MLCICHLKVAQICFVYVTLKRVNKLCICYFTTIMLYICYMQVITPFFHDRARGEAECEIIQKTFYNRLITRWGAQLTFGEKIFTSTISFSLDNVFELHVTPWFITSEFKTFALLKVTQKRQQKYFNDSTNIEQWDNETS